MSKLNLIGCFLSFSVGLYTLINGLLLLTVINFIVSAINLAVYFVTKKTVIIGVCRVCGCTDNDCSQCIAKTGSPCYWVKPDLCSACVKGDDS